MFLLQITAHIPIPLPTAHLPLSPFPFGNPEAGSGTLSFERPKQLS